MTHISVPASRQYDVVVEGRILDRAGICLHQVLKPESKVAIISDTNVWPLYGPQVQNSLTQAGFQVVRFVFQAGESSKNASTYLDILKFLAENQLTLAPGIACINQHAHLFAAGEFQNFLEAIRRLGNGFQLHAAWHHGQVVHLPRQTLAVLRLRFFLFNQMTYGRGDDDGVVGVAAV